MRMSAPTHAGSPPAPSSIRAGDAFAAAAIVLVAAAMRVWNIDSGIPYAVGVDEPEIMERAVRMMKTMDFNPHFFDWPTLTIYVEFVVSCLAFLAGSMRGLWSNLDQVTAANFYEVGRLVGAAFGTGTILVTYFAARRWGAKTALLAAGLMAVMPIHVRESHYALADIPTAFFTTLALLLALRALERPVLGSFIWAGAAVGLAASCKYNGLIAIVLPLIAAVAAGGGLVIVLQRALAIGATAAGAFLLGTPYALLDLPKFLNDYARLAAVFARERGGEPGWSIYLKHLLGSLAWPGVVAAVVGALVAVGRAIAGPHRARWVMLIVFPVLYFKVMASSYQIYGRYTPPLLPFLSLWAAVAVSAAATWIARRPWPRPTSWIAATAMVAGVLAVPAWSSVTFNQGLGQTSTVDLAYRWITEHVRPGAKFAIETRVMLLPARYPSSNVRSLAARPYDEYEAEGYDYFLASSVSYGPALDAPADHPDAHAAYQALFARATEVATFEPNDRRPGPTLRIFRLQR